jgi:mannitol-1-/sugar-/sorbitol-6-phosphatase
MEEVESRGLDVVPGAAALLALLGDRQWAVVTSGSLVVASLRLRTGGIPIPPVLVTAGDVRRGKPDPEGYLLGARRLGVEPEECLVIEDAPPGVAAGKAAGMRVIALLTTHKAEQLADADARLDSLAALRIAVAPSVLTVDV